MRIGPMGGLFRLAFACCILPLALAGCASLGGSPPRVIGAQSDALLTRYSMTKALTAFAAPESDNTPREGLGRQQYRDMVVAVYIGIIDARYDDFRSRISDERRELGVGFDAVVIGLTSAAAVARDSIVNTLSATAATMAGTRAAIDRNVYFDQSLPGLLAAMDAQRIRARTQIIQNLQRTDVQYPLATAFADLSAYESAGSIDAAIVEITAQAAVDRQAALAEYATAVRACDTAENIRPNITRVMAFVVARQKATDLAGMRSLATLMGLTTTDTDTAGAIRDRIRDDLIANYCSNQQLETLINRAKVEPWGSTI